jgi:hypothetical protein
MTRETLKAGVLALLCASAATAQDQQPTQDPCELFKIHTQLESLMASGYGRVCEVLGPVRLTSECMNYYILATGDFDMPENPDLAARCKPGAAGGTTLVQGDGTGAAPELPPECGVDGLECRPEPPDPVPVGPCGGEGEPDCMTDAGIGAIDEPAPVDTGDAMECRDRECREPDQVPVPVDADAAPAASDPQDRALDLAFWQSIADSADATLFEAYLRQFPNGTFRPIAEARLREVDKAGGGTAPAPDPVAAAPEPDALYRAAMDRLNQVFVRPPGEWNAAAREPIALLEQAAALGQADAMIELGSLAEQGIGMATDNGIAVRRYLQAAEAGAVRGYFRALMVLDQIGDNTGFVSVFEQAYRAAPLEAIEVLARDVSRQASVWLQQMLRAARYYDGPLDGAFGAASKAALDAYLSGGPAPVAAPAAIAVPDDRELARMLQAELARVGCYGGAIDGLWGAGSAQAMFAFNHWMAGTAPTDRPTAAALEDVRAAVGLVCGVD